MDGNLVLYDILVIMGVEVLVDYMINEVQDVYCLQGVKINDKYIEVIVCQMLQKWEILDSGDIILLKGEIVDKVEYDEVNVKVVVCGGCFVQGELILFGIIKVLLQICLFILVVLFQEIICVLIEVLVQGKCDKLVGLKENVIVGCLILVGIGGVISKVCCIVIECDNVVLEICCEEV